MARFWLSQDHHATNANQTGNPNGNGYSNGNGNGNEDKDEHSTVMAVIRGQVTGKSRLITKHHPVLV